MIDTNKFYQVEQFDDYSMIASKANKKDVLRDYLIFKLNPCASENFFIITTSDGELHFPTADEEWNRSIRSIDFYSDGIFIEYVRCLKAGWTVNMNQNVTSLFGVNVDSELIDVMAQSIKDDIDNDIINSLLAGCET